MTTEQIANIIDLAEEVLREVNTTAHVALDHGDYRQAGQLDVVAERLQVQLLRLYRQHYQLQRKVTDD